MKENRKVVVVFCF